MDDKEKQLFERLNRRELKLINSLNDISIYAEDIPAIGWFQRIFTAWIAPQTPERKKYLKAILNAALECFEK